MSLQISNTDLIHILDNLLRNSVSNLLTSETKSPAISIKLNQLGAADVEILIIDNGTGLTKQKFNLIASTKSNEFFKTSDSLGLKLIRRFVENNGGELDVIDQEQFLGTIIMLKLKQNIAKSIEMEEIPYERK